MAVRIHIESDALALAQRYQAAASIVRGLIARGMDEENSVTVNYIQLNKLTAAGPRYLNVRTGRLRRAVAATKATIEGSFIRSSIGANVTYGRAHEFGFSGPVQVRSFIRRTVRTRSLKTGKKLKKAVTTGTTTVKPFIRKVNMRARRMFRDGIDERVRSGAYGRKISDLIRTEFGRPVSRPPRDFPE